MNYSLEVFYGDPLASNYWQRCLDLLEGETDSELKTVKNCILVAAKNGEEVIGWVMAAYFPLTRFAKINYLVVAPLWRRKKIGSCLLKKIGEELIEKGCYGAFINYEKKESSHMQQFLLAHKAEDFHIAIVRTYFDVHTFSPPWLQYKLKLPEGVTLFKWEQLKSEEKDSLERLLEGGAFPAVLSPFLFQERVAYFNSYGLRAKEQGVIGWIVTHFVNEKRDPISYSTFYIDPRYRYGVSPIILLSSACKGQIHSDITCAFCDLNVSEVDSRWSAFLRKRLIPYSTGVKEWWQATLSFKNLI